LGEETIPQDDDGDPPKANGSRVVAVAKKGNAASNKRRRPKKSRAAKSKRTRPIREDVRDIVSGFGDEVEIAQGQIREQYMQMHPDADSKKVRPSISHALRQLMEEGELERVSEGVASEPHRYRKTKSREQPVSD
jgi:hypothetical protein